MPNEGNIDTIVSVLTCKIEKLIKQHISSLEKIEKQNTLIKEQEEELRRLRGENRKLNDSLKTARLAEALANGSGDAEARAKIDRLVREIDKCIALLDK